MLVRLQTSAGGSGDKHVIVGCPDSTCSLEAFMLPLPMQKESAWKLFKNSQIVFLLRTSYTNHISDVFLVVTASTSLFDAFQAADSGRKVLICAPPWRLQVPFASFG